MLYLLSLLSHSLNFNRFLFETAVFINELNFATLRPVRHLYHIKKRGTYSRKLKNCILNGTA